MSMEALHWSLGLEAPSAGAKLVLILMANRADERGRCWPTVQRLAAEAQLPEHVIRESLRLLVGANLIREELGNTSSKRIFTLLYDDEVAHG